ncbi:MAG TPA: anthranilate synthase component I family protein [Acidimicrobiia bacterium]|nr:anthranilate synthase component I family protein [Acidimicrobiia bacterium]
MRHSDTIAAALLARVPAEVDAAVWRRGGTTVVGVGAEEVVVAGADAFGALDRLAAGTWVGWLAFELGHAVEPVVARGASACEPPQVPDVVLARFGAQAVVAADGEITLDGTGVGRTLLHDARRDLLDATPAPAASRRRGVDLRWRSSLRRDEFEARVGAIVELLRAGECYQVNLTRRLTLDAHLDPVGLFAQLAHHHPAPFTGLLRVHHHSVGDVAVVCASPERYLRVDGRSVETQPIKGTAVDAHVLRASAKDRAENVMIVDLARNDLGRVCEPGSIEVPSLFAMEAHPGLHHLVSTVRGTRRADVGLSGLIAATFPPASVTGAPKPRVLQAIDDLEPVRRGVYCGGFGWIDTARDQADLAVAIRTFTVFPDRTELGVGAGIVADSSPAAEWEETELKAARLLARADDCAREPIPERRAAAVAMR